MRTAITLLLAAGSLLALAPSSSAQPEPWHCSGGPQSSFCTVSLGPCEVTSGTVQSQDDTYTYHDVGCTVNGTDCGVSAQGGALAPDRLLRPECDPA